MPIPPYTDDVACRSPSFAKFACIALGLYLVAIGVFQLIQWRQEVNRPLRVRAILVVDSHRRPVEGAKIRMKGESFRPVFPVLSFVLQRWVWHPQWKSDFQTTGKDGVVRFSYKSDSAHIAELRIEDRSITVFSNWWLHADGSPEPADVYLVPEVRRDGEEEKETVIIMKGKPNQTVETTAVECPPSNHSPLSAVSHL